LESCCLIPSGTLWDFRHYLYEASTVHDSYKLTLRKAADGSEIAKDYYFNIVRK
jgi:hypothetical protein